MEIEKSYRFRLRILYGILCAALALFTAVLYDAQIIRGQAYYEQSTSRIPSYETVEASRGIITDRNGKVLVSNRQVYTLTLDASLLGEDPNGAILRLLKLCRSYGVTWTDNLPLRQEAPYLWITDGASSQRSQLQKFLADRGWSTAELTAESPYPAWAAGEKGQAAAEKYGSFFSGEAMMDLLREEFGLDGSWSGEDARLVAGVRYELACRALAGQSTYLFAEDVPVEILSEITDGRFAGVTIGTDSVRQYETDYAAHILGYIGQIWADELDEYTAQGYQMNALVGKTGAEKAFEEYLRGSNGRRVITTNEEGRITEEIYSTEPEPGGTVALTLDIDLQEVAERSLAAQVESLNEKDGMTTRAAAAVAVRVGTGEVLAMASYPTYDLKTLLQNYNAVLNDPSQPLFNRATMGAYPPGSTFKPMTAVAALESGAITTTERIRTTGIYTYYAPSYTPKCWYYPGAHGSINVSQAIKVSCNCFFYEAGRRTGINTLVEYAHGFGLGLPTGLEIGESSGVMDGPEYRSAEGKLYMGGDTLQISIGQGESLFTPIQLANYIATLVGGGDHYALHLLKDVRSHDGIRLLKTYDDGPTNTVEMSEATLAAVKKGMGDLVTSGSVSGHFRRCVVTAGAKTGSAQTGTNIDNGVFVAFAPFDEPEIAIAIIVEKGGTGGAQAPVAVDIINAYFAGSDSREGNWSEGTLTP